MVAHSSKDTHMRMAMIWIFAPFESLDQISTLFFMDDTIAASRRTGTSILQCGLERWSSCLLGTLRTTITISQQPGMLSAWTWRFSRHYP
jgi:hypothetical protein